jgi:hypothetical protein
MYAEFEAGDPGRTLNMIDQSHLGNLQITKRRRVWENCLDVVSDDAAIVRLRHVWPRGRGCGGRGRPILDHLTRRAIAQGHCKRQQIHTNGMLTEWPLVRSCCVRFSSGHPRLHYILRQADERCFICRVRDVTHARCRRLALTIWFQNAAFAWCRAGRAMALRGSLSAQRPVSMAFGAAFGRQYRER